MIKDFIFQKHMAAIGLAGFLFIGGISPVIADDEQPNPIGSNALDALKEDLENFGKYLGYTLTEPPTNPTPSSKIDDSVISVIKTFQKSAIDLFLGTIPSTSIMPPDINALNNLTNKLFNSQAAGASTLDSNHSIDQKESKTATSGGGGEDTVAYPDDPISQSIVNLLGTPSHGMCILITGSPSGNANASDSSRINCSSPALSYQEAIALKVIGALPKPTDAYSINSTLTNQLNSNTLISPFIYSTTGSSPSAASKGLPAGNQAQEAENFIRYASSAVSPPTQLSAEAFQALYTQANPKGGFTKENTPAALSATASLASYFTNMRTYAAQISVGTGNLYQMLSRRMPQTIDGKATSEAYNEYLMATKRLYNPGSADQQWVDQINSDSPAAVQKEIAILLSEINYQLYLSRQQDERLLLTNTAMLFQLSHLVIPAPPPAPTPGSTGSGG